MGLLSGRRPGDLGIRDGRLKPAPASPNAVSSQAEDAQHAIAPLEFAGSPEHAMETLARLVQSTPRTRIVARSADYLYAEYTSALLRFVDDVEFWLEPGTRRIHVRSASRLGYRDFGVNRARVEDLRRRLTAAGV